MCQCCVCFGCCFVDASLCVSVLLLFDLSKLLLCLFVCVDASMCVPVVFIVSPLLLFLFACC